MASKSVGTLRYPHIRVERFNSGEVTLLLDDHQKKVRIEFSIHCLKRLMEIIHEIVDMQRRFAQSEWNIFCRLKKVTGYEEPSDG